MAHEAVGPLGALQQNLSDLIGPTKSVSPRAVPLPKPPPGVPKSGRVLCTSQDEVTKVTWREGIKPQEGRAAEEPVAPEIADALNGANHTVCSRFTRGDATSDDASSTRDASSTVLPQNLADSIGPRKSRVVLKPTPRSAPKPGCVPCTSWVEVTRSGDASTSIINTSAKPYTNNNLGCKLKRAYTSQHRPKGQ